MRCIRQGFQPSRYLHEHLDRRSLGVWLGSRNFKARKPKPKIIQHHFIRRLRLTRKRKPLSTPGVFVKHDANIISDPGNSAYFPPSIVPKVLHLREGDGSPPRDYHAEGVASPPPQAREPRRSRAPSFPLSRACRRHEKSEDCIALAFGQESSDAVYKPACISPALDSGGNVDQDAGGVPRDPLESLGTPGPSGPSSPLLACPRHRRGGGWSILDPCQDCLLLAMQADL